MKIIDWIKIWMAYRKAKANVEAEVKKMEGLNMGKSKWKSKTLWFNVITGAVTVAGVLANSALAADPKIQAAVALFITIGNGVLRFMTNEPLAK